MIKRIANCATTTAAFLLIMLVTSGITVAQVATNIADPFARLEAQLNDAASRTLERAVQLDPPKTMYQPPHNEDISPALPPARGDQGPSQRFGQLRTVLEPILREVGVPAELAAVVQVESGGDPAALSPKGARGLWQLMPDTARRYGLIVSDAKDERLDPQKATWAATRYLRDLHQMFGDWSLALAAYNAGEDAVWRAMTRFRSRQFDVLSLEHALPEETRRYVPAVMAAMGRLTNANLPGEGSRINTKNRSPLDAAMGWGNK